MCGEIDQDAGYLDEYGSELGLDVDKADMVEKT